MQLLPPSLPRFLPSFLYPWACSHQKWQSVYPTLYLFSFLLALVFSRDKGEGRRGRTGLIPGRSRCLGLPSPPAPNQPQDNQPIFLFPLFFFFCCFVKIFLSVLYLPAAIFFPPLSLDKFLVVSSDCSCEEGGGRCPLLGWGSPSTSL